MSKEELDNLVRIEQLAAEPGSRAEFDGLVSSGRNRLADARNSELAAESRFDLAYNAAHALALAALRQNGYRPKRNRYVVFQALVHTVGLGRAEVEVFSKAHNERNLAEYQGHTEVDERLLSDLIRCTMKLEAAVSQLKPPVEA